ncbi:MAG: phage holin family protein [Polyangiales bacterium]
MMDPVRGNRAVENPGTDIDPTMLDSGVHRSDALSTNGQRELGALVADVWENAEKLVRQELELGLSEIDRRVDKLKTGLTVAVIGGAVLYAGILVLLAAVVLGLSNVMAPWLAALIVGGLVTGAGVTMSKRGTDKAAESAQPDEHLNRTVGAMKEAIK